LEKGKFFEQKKIGGEKIYFAILNKEGYSNQKNSRAN
jgi:hypothetical protein